MKRVMAILLIVIVMMTSASFAAQTIKFSEMEDHWAKEYVNSMAKEGILDGYEDGTFRPDNLVTRAEFAKIIAVTYNLKSSSKEKYSDVEEHWAKEYIADALDYFSGYKVGNISYYLPDEPATREDVIAAMVKIYDESVDDAKLSLLKKYSDSDSISSYLKPYVAKAIELELIKGYEDNTIRPKGNLTRAEACTVIYNEREINNSNHTIKSESTKLDEAAEVPDDVTKVKKEEIKDATKLQEQMKITLAEAENTDSNNIITYTLSRELATNSELLEPNEHLIIDAIFLDKDGKEIIICPILDVTSGKSGNIERKLIDEKADLLKQLYTERKKNLYVSKIKIVAQTGYGMTLSYPAVMPVTLEEYLYQELTRSHYLIKDKTAEAQIEVAYAINIPYINNEPIKEPEEITTSDPIKEPDEITTDNQIKVTINGPDIIKNKTELTLSFSRNLNSNEGEVSSLTFYDKSNKKLLTLYINFGTAKMIQGEAIFDSMRYFSNELKNVDLTNVVMKTEVGIGSRNKEHEISGRDSYLTPYYYIDTLSGSTIKKLKLENDSSSAYEYYTPEQLEELYNSSSIPRNFVSSKILNYKNIVPVARRTNSAEQAIEFVKEWWADFGDPDTILSCTLKEETPYYYVIDLSGIDRNVGKLDTTHIFMKKSVYDGEKINLAIINNNEKIKELFNIVFYIDRANAMDVEYSNYENYYHSSYYRIVDSNVVETNNEYIYSLYYFHNKLSGGFSFEKMEIVVDKNNGKINSKENHLIYTLNKNK